MKDFNILNPNQEIFGHYFLEASAGTGKTFTIEHIFIRLLLEINEININKILIITFTKKATFELVSRVKNNLEKTLLNLKNNSLENLPKYIYKNTNVKQFYNKLLTSYLNFPENSIFTIHGFCYYLINSFFIGKANGEIISSKTEYILDASRNYLTSKKFLKLLSTEQIKKLITRYPKNLDIEITKHIIQKTSKEEVISLTQLKKKICSKINSLKLLCQKYPFSALYEILVNDLKKFKNTCNKQQQLKKEIEKNLIFTIENMLKKDDFFLQEGWLNSPFIYISKENLKQKYQALHDVSTAILYSQISELLIEYFNTNSIIQWISKEILDEEINRKSLIKEDDILSLTLSCLKTFPKITEKIREFYSAVLVDEFQDTDPIQWNIIKLLFLNPHSTIKSFFLIGDPKQAIYGFRNADIYTYKNAQKHFLSNNIFSLNTNYRATPELVSAINFLFSRNEKIFYLPKNKECLSYRQLKNDPQNQFNYKRRCPCHFFSESTEKDLFDVINQEILFLTTIQKIPINKIAILIKDQNQGLRFSSNCPFPIDTNKSIDLSKSYSIQIIKTFLTACMNPDKPDWLILVLLGPLFRKTTEEILENFNNYINLFFSYQKILYSSGILELFYSLMKQQGEIILQHPQGQLLYQEIEYIVDYLHSLTNNSHSYLYFLEKLYLLGSLDDKLKANFSETSEEALQMLTIHAAKGMEFEAVFTIGLIKSHVLSYKDHKEEIYEEKIRQTYVAFTRAKKFLYIPILEKEESNSPIALFLNKVLLKKNIASFIKLYPQLFSYSQNINKSKIDYQKQSPLIQKPNTLEFYFSKETKLTSFSKIKKDILPIYNELNINNVSTNSGLEFGSFCHYLLEKINFSLLQKTTNKEQMKKIIAPFFSFKQQIWIDDIASMLFNLFNSLLTFPEDSFYLKDINPFKIFKESEFLFLDEHPKLFIKGFIDLFFEHKNVFYVIDWKTNFLGESLSDYVSEKLHKFSFYMKYDQQIEFYLKAAKKYLKLFSLNNPSCYGSIIFLRGLSNNTGMISY